MKFRLYRQRPPGHGTTQVVLGDVVLKRAQQDVHHRIGDGYELQRAVAWSLRRQGRPALESAEHRTDRGRRDLLDVGSEGRIERIVVLPVPCKYVAIYLAEIAFDPTLDRPAVAMRRQAERRGAGRPATQTIGIDRHALRV